MTVCIRLLLALLLLVPLAAQEPSARLREVLGKIVSDPRFKDMQKYTDALQPAARLKQDLLEGERLARLNSVYGWELTADGNWPVERINDIMFEIVMSPRFDHGVFVAALDTGAPVLRTLRERDCVDAFNRKYELSIPESGGLPFAQAEKFLYDVVASPGFDPARVLAGLCRDAKPRPAPPVPAPVPTRTDVSVPAPDNYPPAGSSHLQARLGLIGGGMLVLSMIALFLWSVVRDRGGA